MSVTSGSLQFGMRTLLQFREAQTCQIFKKYLSDGPWILTLTQVGLTPKCTHSTTNKSLTTQTQHYNLYNSKRECQNGKTGSIQHLKDNSK